MFQRGDAVDREQEIVGVLSRSWAGDMGGVTERLDPFLHAIHGYRGEVAQRLKCLGAFVVTDGSARQQDQQKCHVFQMIRRVVGGFQQRTEDPAIGPAAGRITRRDDQQIGVVFEAARAIRAFVEAVAGATGRQHAILHQRGDFEDQAGMIRGDTQQPALVVAEMP